MQGAALIVEAPATFDSAFEANLDALYRTALRLTRNAQDAEDLIQETAIRAFRAWDRLAPESNVRAWLFRILMNGYINTYRRKATGPKTTSLDDAEEFFLYNHISSQRDEHLSQSAEDEALGRIVVPEVRNAIEALPEQFRATVVLADVEGFSYREIAEITGVKIGTVMSRLNRGRRLLQKRLVDYAREQGIVRPALEAR